ALVFFQAHGGHRHLPSFPTRRSSDLAADDAKGGRDMMRFTRVAIALGCTAMSATQADAAPPSRAREAAVSTAVITNCYKMADRRSEEHTSELQSLTNLVCRLLLEKKK